MWRSTHWAKLNGSPAARRIRLSDARASDRPILQYFSGFNVEFLSPCFYSAQTVLCSPQGGTAATMGPWYRGLMGRSRVHSSVRPLQLKFTLESPRLELLTCTFSKGTHTFCRLVVLTSSKKIDRSMNGKELASAGIEPDSASDS